MTAPWWASDDGDVVLHLGKCEDVLPGLPADSVDAIVTDPPAAVGFMGKTWDSNLGGRDRWVAWLAGCMEAAARVLKPGGHLLVWSLPRTSHWTAWALEDAGLEIRDCVLHLFGSGFPKSLDVSKAIDKAAGAEREVIGRSGNGGIRSGSNTLVGVYAPHDGHSITAPATEDAARWEGWGTALKPGQEMWWLARKPLEGTVAGNVLEYGTGALNIDGCKVGTDAITTQRQDEFDREERSGRWPANIVLTHSADCQPAGTREVAGNARARKKPVGAEKFPGAYGALVNDADRPYGAPGVPETVQVWACAPGCPVAELDRQSGVLTTHAGTYRRETAATDNRSAYRVDPPPGHVTSTGDTGGASRFYPVFRYQAKAPASERPRLGDGTAHECVKPLELIRWLCRLVTPPGGTVLDLFAGSGTTAEACVIEGFRCVLVEQDPKSAGLIRARLAKPIQPVLLSIEAS